MGIRALGGSVRRSAWGLFMFTLVINILVLVQPIYMLQIYDRVLTAASIETLLFISLIAVAALLILGAIDAVRSMIAGRIAARLEVEHGHDAFIASLTGPRAPLGDVQPLRDLALVRGFLTGRAVFGFLDLPFVPLFLGILYLIHPDLFWMTLAGVVVLAGLALLNQYGTRQSTEKASAQSIAALLSAQAFVRNAESLGALGMVGNAVRTWGTEESGALAAQDRLNRINSIYAGLSRMLRMGLQIAILGYGGYLVLDEQMTAGMIFAASLISGRGLQPLDQVIGGWKSHMETRKAWKRLTTAMAPVARSAQRTDLPEPEGALSLEQLIVMPPQNTVGAEPLLKRVSASIGAGECVAMIGPSGAGKSTLLRTIVGAVIPRSGAVRVDGADIRQWDQDALGRHLGYLAQEIELLPGTVAQNIARFDPAPDDAAIIAAARKAEVHDLILKLPAGYDTPLGPTGHRLSGGQRQRIGLARAFYGSPRILVLDEPNANLDGEGEAALERALFAARSDKVTVLIVTQRRGVVERADSIMVLRDGAVEDFGPRLEVLARQAERAKLAQRNAQKTAQGAAAGMVAAPTVVSGHFPAVLKGGKQPAEQ